MAPFKPKSYDKARDSRGNFNKYGVMPLCSSTLELNQCRQDRKMREKLYGKIKRNQQFLRERLGVGRGVTMGGERLQWWKLRGLEDLRSCQIGPRGGT